MERALDTALAAWRQHPTSALADRLDHLSDELTRQHPAISAADWEHRCSLKRPIDLGPLLAALPPMSAPEWGARIDRLAGWPRDPRLTTELSRQLLQRLPRAEEHAVWRRVLGLVAWVGDVRAATWLAEALGELDGRFAAGRALTLRANELIVFLANRPGLLSVRSAVPRSVTTPIVRAPKEPTERAILADQLLERGDARGELIVLQSLDQPRAEQRRRSKALLREYAGAWLGRLAPALKREGLQFEHGFVVAGRVSGYRALRRLIGVPEWSGIRALDLRELRWRHAARDLLLAFLTHPVMQTLERVEHFPAAEVSALLRAKKATSIAALGVTGWLEPVAIDELRQARALPKLTSLVINGVAFEWPVERVTATSRCP